MFHFKIFIQFIYTLVKITFDFKASDIINFNSTFPNIPLRRDFLVFQGEHNFQSATDV